MTSATDGLVQQWDLTDENDDQLMKHDQAIIDWLAADFSSLIVGRTNTILISTPHHGYIEVETRQNVTQERLTTPRIAITRGDFMGDPQRFNANKIRRLGRVDPSHLYKLRQGLYPIPIIIPYQIDFWTEMVREMNRWSMETLIQFSFQYKYFQINVDAVWGDKQFVVFQEGPLVSTSDLESGNQPRIIRRSLSLRAETWLYDQTFEEVAVVKRIDLEFHDAEDLSHIETVSPNRIAPALYVASGGTVFSGAIIDAVYRPILPNTFVLNVSFGATPTVTQDDGDGNLFGTNVSSGSINYATGTVDVTYSTAPDSGDLEASWLTDLI